MGLGLGLVYSVLPPSLGELFFGQVNLVGSIPSTRHIPTLHYHHHLFESRPGDQGYLGAKYRPRVPPQKTRNPNPGDSNSTLATLSGSISVQMRCRYPTFATLNSCVGLIEEDPDIIEGPSQIHSNSKGGAWIDTHSGVSCFTHSCTNYLF